jgi:hypothetical protein
MSEETKKGNAWTNFVRDWAKENGTTYMVAIKDPAVSTAYKNQKKTTRKAVKEDTFDKLKADAVSMAEAIDPPPVKRKAGRPSKYATEEEKKEAKRLKTLASNKKKREEIQKAKKEGTMTEEQKEKYQRDSDKKVAWTAEMRVRKRAEAIVKLQASVNKVEKYIYDNEDEFFKNFDKDPYSPHIHNRKGGIYYSDVPESKKWKPSGEYQIKAWSIFGDADFEDVVKRALTQQERDDLYADIPNYDTREYHRENIKTQLEKIRRKMSRKWDDESKKLYALQKEMMGEDVPGKVIKAKETAMRYLYDGKIKMERKNRKKREDEKERKRRAALSDYERREEDRLAKIESDRFLQRLLGRGRKGKPYTSLAHLPFWDN